MKAAEWIDRLKVAKGWESDYRAAQELGITRGAMSQIRTGDSVTLREETALRVAELLHVDPAGVIIDQVAERSKDKSLSTALHRVARQLCILCKVPSALHRRCTDLPASPAGFPWPPIPA